MAKAKKQRTVSFTVTFPLPERALIVDAREYVEDAVASLKGSYRPPGSLTDDDLGHPMFGLDGDAVRVTYIRPADRKRRNSR